MSLIIQIFGWRSKSSYTSHVSTFVSFLCCNSWPQFNCLYHGISAVNRLYIFLKLLNLILTRSAASTQNAPNFFHCGEGTSLYIMWCDPSHSCSVLLYIPMTPLFFLRAILPFLIKWIIYFYHFRCALRPIWPYVALNHGHNIWLLNCS